MFESDYILLYTSGLISSDDLKSKENLEALSLSYEIEELRKPNSISLGGRGPHSMEINYVDWIRWLRNQGIQKLRFHYVGSNGTKLPAHIATAFQGAVEFIMEIITPEQNIAFTLISNEGPRYELRVDQFLELINHQSKKDSIWIRINELINESNQLNDRPEVLLDQTSNYLLSKEGVSLFEYLADNLFNEIQIECNILGLVLQIPNHLKSFFFKPEYHFTSHFNDHVYLYDLRKVTGAELNALIQAQPFAEKLIPIIWKECKQQNLSIVTLATEHNWISALQKMSSVETDGLNQIVYQSIIKTCEEENRFPTIPDALKECFGPDEIGQKRARERGHYQNKWQLVPNQNPWRLLFFETIANFHLAKNTVSSSNETQKHFLDELNAIAVFAEKVKSPFSEAFRLAQFILNKEFIVYDFVDTTLEMIAPLMKQMHFSQNAETVLKKNFYYAEKMKQIGWSTEKCKELLALTCCEVFGGMGSWNDQSFDNDLDQQTYEELSARFFKSKKEYFASLL
ncbi:MAG: hypothetical protein JST58_11565 [Bacteroidetes bacterium]|nr:hypothetical protein [Bacteroidota bacterium]